MTPRFRHNACMFDRLRGREPAYSISRR
jgi:hypothetical protein